MEADPFTINEHVNEIALYKMIRPGVSATNGYMLEAGEGVPTFSQGLAS